MKLFGIVALSLSAAALGQKLDPVQWTLASEVDKAPPGATVPLKLTATIEPGWHVYSFTAPRVNGQTSIATTAKIAENPSVASHEIFQPPPIFKRDENFQADLEMFEKSMPLWVPAQLASDAKPGPTELTAEVRYFACDNARCLPPKTKTATATLIVDPESAVPTLSIPAEFRNIKEPAQRVPEKSADGGFIGFAALAFGAGLAAIFTPCVFPMIPITVSYFLKNNKGGIFHAAAFALGIIVLFVALGLGVTALLGPFGVQQMSSNPWVNGFIAAVFAVFATSLLGAFEITLPSGLLTKMDAVSRGGGLFGPLLMGLTFSLTSFACVGPFVGPLLAASVQGQGDQPVIGMASFATGLASPFFLLAAFPAVLKKLPKSGGWLMRVKVVMGFVLLALTIKYLSNIDQVLQTGFLTRERFLAAWFVLFGMAGLYLLGLLRLEGIEPGEKLGIGRLVVASLLLMFAFSLLPGMFGARLGEIDAYVPAAQGGAFNGSQEAGPVWMKDQYREALAKAKDENKLVLVNFTGYVCTNCHWMKANMFPRPEIAAALSELVLVDLYCDGGDATSEENQRLEEEKFDTNTMPFYALMDADENVIATFGKGLTRDTQEFLAFLKTRRV